MSNSALISHTRISPNSTNPRNKPILKITPHHMAGNLTLEAFGNLVAQSLRQMSSNYAIETSGRIGLYCEEKNRSWCSSSAANDHQAITIEVANDGGAPDWHVSDAALASLIDLCTDICRRNSIAQLVFTGDATGNLTQHNYFTATACPGPYLKSKFQYIAEEVNRRLATPTGGIETMKGLKIEGTKNVEGFNSPNVNDVVVSQLQKQPGTYQVYESGRDIGGIKGSLIRYPANNGDLYKVWVAEALSGSTGLVDVAVAEAETLWGWYDTKTETTGVPQEQYDALQAQLAASNAAKYTAEAALTTAQTKISNAQKALG